MGQLSVEGLQSRLLELCQQGLGDEQLARELVASDLLDQILAAGACDSSEAAQMLGYKSKRSVESMAQKSPHFPQPRLRGSLWSVKQLERFTVERGRNRA